MGSPPHKVTLEPGSGATATRRAAGGRGEGGRGAAAPSRARGGDRGCVEGRAGVGRAERGAPPRGPGRRGSGLGAPGETRAAVPGARRAEAWRGAAERGPAGRGDALGALRACAGAGRLVGAGPVRGPGRDAALAAAAPLRAGAGAGARGADEVWEPEEDRAPGEEKCAGDAGVGWLLCLSQLPPRANSVAATLTGELFGETCCFQMSGDGGGGRAGRWSRGAPRGCRAGCAAGAPRAVCGGKGHGSETGCAGRAGSRRGRELRSCVRRMYRC